MFEEEDKYTVVSATTSLLDEEGDCEGEDVLVRVPPKKHQEGPASAHGNQQQHSVSSSTASGETPPLGTDGPTTSSSSSPSSALLRYSDSHIQFAPMKLMGDRYRQLKLLGVGAFGQAVLVLDTVTQDHLVVKRLGDKLSSPVDEPLKPVPVSQQQQVVGPHGKAMDNNQAGAPPRLVLPGSSDEQRRVAHHQRGKKKHDSKGTKELQEETRREIDNLQRLDHEHIVKFHRAWFDTDRHLHILMEFCDGGDLSQFLEKYFPLPEHVLRSFLTQLLIALDHVHKQHMLHRDIKLQNIFVCRATLMLKLGDFGLSKSLKRTDDAAQTQAGTPLYFSPEIASAQPYTRKADIWSLGVAAYFLLTNHRPFGGKSLSEVIRNISYRQPLHPHEMVKRLKYKFPVPKYSDELCDAVLMMLRKDPKQRPTAAQVLHSCVCAETAQLRPWHMTNDCRSGGESTTQTTSSSTASSTPTATGRNVRTMVVCREGAKVNIRSAPSKTASKLGSVSFGEVIQVECEVHEDEGVHDDTDHTAPPCSTKKNNSPSIVIVWYKIVFPISGGYCISSDHGKYLFKDFNDPSRVSPLRPVAFASPLDGGADNVLLPPKQQKKKITGGSEDQQKEEHRPNHRRPGVVERLTSPTPRRGEEARVTSHGDHEDHRKLPPVKKKCSTTEECRPRSSAAPVGASPLRRVVNQQQRPTVHTDANDDGRHDHQRAVTPPTRGALQNKKVLTPRIVSPVRHQEDAPNKRITSSPVVTPRAVRGVSSSPFRPTLMNHPNSKASPVKQVVASPPLHRPPRDTTPTTHGVPPSPPLKNKNRKDETPVRTPRGDQTPTRRCTTPVGSPVVACHRVSPIKVRASNPSPLRKRKETTQTTHIHHASDDDQHRRLTPTAGRDRHPSSPLRHQGATAAAGHVPASSVPLRPRLSPVASPVRSPPLVVANETKNNKHSVSPVRHRINTPTSKPSPKG